MNKLKQLYLDFNSKHARLCEIMRFLIVGGIATIIDWLVMGIVLYIFNPSLYPKFYNVWIGKVGDPSTIATIVGTGMGFSVSLIFNYLLSVLFVYEEKGSSKSVKGAVLFALMSAGGLLLNVVGMWFGFDICGIDEWIVKILMTLIVMSYNYLTRKLIIFRKVENKTAVETDETNNNEMAVEIDETNDNETAVETDVTNKDETAIKIDEANKE